MRELQANEISTAVSSLVQDANYDLNADLLEALLVAEQTETSARGRKIIRQLIENQEIARTEEVPICQDTGFAVFFVDVGQDLRIVGGDLEESINKGVRRGYQEGYLRKSIVADPFKRINTGDNTPSIIHYRIVPGDRLRLRFMAKGGGSENMSFSRMLTPADGVTGVKDFVYEAVVTAGGRPCPPIIVGVGIGGTMEKAALLAKESLLRKLGDHNPDPDIAALEEELLELVNLSDVGPQGLGGKTTALAVNIEVFPTHIATLPVVVNLGCHASRHREVTL